MIGLTFEMQLQAKKKKKPQKSNWLFWGLLSKHIIWESDTFFEFERVIKESFIYKKQQESNESTCL